MATAGYSGTPLPKKLGVKPGARVALVDAPRGFERTLGALPDGAKATRGLAGSAPLDVLLVFVASQAALRAALPKARARMRDDAGLWVCWPKKSSGVETDVDENVVRAAGLAAKLVDVKVCAIDETWSGLRLVVRVRDRAK